VSQDFAIHAEGLTRYFGRKCAVDQMSLRVRAGSVYALLGRNGSGKSTFIRMLLGLLEPTRGRSSVLGEDSQHLTPATRGKIGFIAEGHPLIGWMRVRDLEAFQRSFYPSWKPQVFKLVSEHFALDPRARASQLSRGQRAGLSLALVLATSPQLLIMDDPSMGLDPVARRTLLEAMILVARNEGHTIFFTSHLLEDVERVADHIAIIDRSVLRVSASVDTFRARVKKFILSFAGAAPAIPAIPGLLQTSRDDHELRVVIANPSDDTPRLLEATGAISVTEAPISLDEAVISYLDSRGTPERVSLLAQMREVEVGA
jgi:ABC-2 type transport system ATP-binding protein